MGDACRTFRWFNDETYTTDGDPADDGAGRCFVWSGTCEPIQKMVADSVTGVLAAVDVGTLYKKVDAALGRLELTSAWDYYEALITPVREWGEFEASGSSRAHIGGALSPPAENRGYSASLSDAHYCVSAAGNAMVAQDDEETALYSAGLWPWYSSQCIDSSTDPSLRFAERCLPSWWQNVKNAARCAAYNSGNEDTALSKAGCVADSMCEWLGLRAIGSNVAKQDNSPM